MSVSGVWPSKGPVSGGTVLSVTGRFLNVGSHVSAYLDALPCHVNKTQSSSHRLVCVTSRDMAEAIAKDHPNGRTVDRLLVKVDGAARVLPTPFTYTPDPKVHELKPLKSPWSGGRMMTVHGTNLDAIQAPRMTVLLQERVLNSSSCRVLGPGQMECPSPPVDRQALMALLRERRHIDNEVLSPQARVSHKVSRYVLYCSHEYDE